VTAQQAEEIAVAAAAIAFGFFVLYADAQAMP
jgi:hypothetical protein